jgi:hypothetical protein
VRLGLIKRREIKGGREVEERGGNNRGGRDKGEREREREREREEKCGIEMEWA